MRPFAFMSLLAVSCAVGPNYVRPGTPKTTGYTVAPLPTATTSAGGVAQRFDQSNRLTAEWWRLLRSPKLDAIVADALANNGSLEAAQATLSKSQNTLRAGYGVFFPSVDAGAGASRQQYGPARVGSPLPPSVFSLFTLSGSVSYTLDVWGGERRTVEGLRAQVEAQRYTVIAAYIILSGNVVNTIVASAAYRAEIDATKELIVLEEEQVRLTDAQAQAGTLPYASAFSLKSQVASTRATLPPLQQKVAQADHLIATLTGRMPAEWSPSPIALDDLKLPDEIPLSLPSELVRQRPDVLVAEAQLHGLTAQIGVATAALLPNVTLSGSYGAASTSAADLFSSGSIFWSVAAALAQPVFHGGALWYQRKAAMDARDAGLASYRQTVLSAFAPVADSLGALEYDAETLNADAEAYRAAEAAFHLVQINYQSGLANYLQVLTANTQYLQSRISFVEAEAQRLQDTVALFVALGGGWWNAGTAKPTAVVRAPSALVTPALGARPASFSPAAVRS
jgi:NodT family efflux transporter outer membrane factor (OMF) lipoprotein